MVSASEAVEDAITVTRPATPHEEAGLAPSGEHAFAQLYYALHNYFSIGISSEVCSKKSMPTSIAYVV
jgi:hypothetical protein